MTSTPSRVSVTLTPGARFSKVPITFQARKAVLCLLCLTQHQSFKNFENDTMKLSVNEAKLTCFRAESCANVHQVLISKFALGLEKLLPLCLDRRTLFSQTEPGRMILIKLLLAAECIKLANRLFIKLNIRYFLASVTSFSGQVAVDVPPIVNMSDQVQSLRSIRAS